MVSGIRSLREPSGETPKVNSDLVKLEQDAKARLLERTALGVRIGLEALSLRSIIVLALIVNAGLMAWALYDPRWERLVGAAAFALFSYCVIHVRPKERNHAET
jgi:hypothetical protein